jgi:hypothetical protein
VHSKFYETPKIHTLLIKFTDKEIVLKDKQEEINNARDVGVMKKEHEKQVYSDVLNPTESSLECYLINLLRIDMNAVDRQFIIIAMQVVLGICRHDLS